jgi:hypothetical protein
MTWQISAGPDQTDVAGRDATGWSWGLLHQDDGRDHHLMAVISGSAYSSSPEGLPLRVVDFRETLGRTEVEAILDWAEPPFELAADTLGVRRVGGRPGPWSKQIVELTEWFTARDVRMFFTGKIVGQGQVYANTYFAHLREAGGKQRQLGSFEGRSEIEAAERARDWWLEHADDPTGEVRKTLAEPGTRAAEGEARLRSERFHLVWTKEDDPRKSAWVCQVFDDDGRLIDMGVGDDVEDAILEVAPRLLPDWK